MSFIDTGGDQWYIYPDYDYSSNMSDTTNIINQMGITNFYAINTNTGQVVKLNMTDYNSIVQNFISFTWEHQKEAAIQNTIGERMRFYVPQVSGHLLRFLTSAMEIYKEQLSPNQLAMTFHTYIPFDRRADMEMIARIELDAADVMLDSVVSLYNQQIMTITI